MVAIEPTSVRSVTAGFSLFLRELRRAKFWGISFLIPFAIRMLPELIAGPYPIGYDTINSYVPFMLDWGLGQYKTTLNPIVGGWLLYAVFGAIYLATHADPILIAKLAAPILYGILGLSEFYFTRTALLWRERKSLLLVIIASADFTFLRLSWDLFRNVLGLALLLFALGWEVKLTSRLRAFIFALLSWSVVAAHLLAGAILVGIVSLEIIYDNRMGRLPRTVLVLPAIIQLFSSLIGLQFLGTPIVAVAGQNQDIISSGAYTVYVLSPFIPLALVGRRTMRNRPMAFWVLLCLAGLLVGGTPIAISSQLVTADRWVLMLGVPIAFYATEGFSHLGSFAFPRPRVRNILGFGWLGLIIVLGATFVVSPASDSFPYFSNFTPTSMLQSSVPLSDSQSMAASFSWLSNNMQNGSALMTHHAVYGWARRFFNSSNPVISFEPGVTLKEALLFTLRQGYHRIYTVWWIDNRGLYGESSVPQGFSLIHVDEDIGVFVYSQ